MNEIHIGDAVAGHGQQDLCQVCQHLCPLATEAEIQVQIMNLVQQLFQPVLQAKNANILGKLQRLRLVADVPLLLEVGFFLLPVLITPVIGVSGNQVAQNTGKNNHQQEDRVYPGQNGQIYQKASDVF